MGIVVRNEGAKVNSNINVTPMVDVMLVMLIIFMVITPMLQHGPPVEVAKANNPMQMPGADEEDALLLAINREGKGFFVNELIKDPADLTQKVTDRIDNRSDRRVYVKADARSKYKWVVEVVDNVRSAGVSELGLLTEQRRQ